MSKKFFTEIRVGIFVMVGLLLAMITIFQIGSENKLFEKQYTLYTSFKDISGLRTGAQVQLAGLNVGFVDEIRFSSDLLIRKITVVLQINSEYQTRIREDSVATVNTQGLLGDKFIYISVGSENKKIISDEGILPSKETTSIFSLAEKAGSIMDDIGNASKSVSSMLETVEGDEKGSIKAIIKSIKNSLGQIEHGNGLFHSLLYDPKGAVVISNLSDTMKAVKEITTGVSEDTKEKTAGLIKNMQVISVDLKEIMGSVRRAEGTLGMLIRDPALYNDLRTLLGRANRNALIKAVIRATLRENDVNNLK